MRTCIGVAMAALIPAIGAAQTTVTWTQTVAGAHTWSDAGNWDLRVPGSGGNVGDVGTLPLSANNQTVTYNAAGPAFQQIIMTEAKNTALIIDAAMTNKIGIYANDWKVHGNRIVFGSNARFVSGQVAGLNVCYTPILVEAGADVWFGSGDLGGQNWNQGITFYHGAMTNRGSFRVGWISSAGGRNEYRRNNTFQISGTGMYVLNDGGLIAANQLQMIGQPGALLVVTNGGSLLCYFGTNPYGLMLQGGGKSSYDTRVRVNGGSVTNHYSRLYLADYVTYGTVSTPGKAAIEIANGLFRQDGAAFIGSARVGTVSVRDGGEFLCGCDVYLGGGVSNIWSAMPAAGLATGVLEVAGGNVTITNAGQAGSAWVYYTQNSFIQATGPAIVSGARIEITNANAGVLSHFDLGRTYYACQVVTSEKFQLNRDLAVVAGESTGGTNGFKYIYYRTFPSRLLVGNWTGFSDGYRLIPGVLRLTAGTLTVNELIATNGAASMIEFSGGTLSARQLTVATGSPLTVGNGTSNAVLNLLAASASSFADGLNINANATLSPGGTGVVQAAAIDGSLTLMQDSRLAWDFSATTQDCLTVSGSVTLPSSATVAIQSLDASAPAVIPMITVAGGFAGSPDGWPKVKLSDHTYGVSVDGNVLLLTKLPRGTCIFVR